MLFVFFSRSLRKKEEIQIGNGSRVKMPSETVSRMKLSLVESDKRWWEWVIGLEEVRGKEEEEHKGVVEVEMKRK